MTVGVNNNGKFEAFLTYLVIFIANLLFLLPRGTLPDLVEVYDCLLRSLFVTVVIYLANKGIQWQAKTEGSK